MFAASDVLVLLASTTAAFYCLSLSRKLKRLSSLDGEIGQAIALLSKEVDTLSKATQAARIDLQPTPPVQGEYPSVKSAFRHRRKVKTSEPRE